MSAGPADLLGQRLSLVEGKAGLYAAEPVFRETLDAVVEEIGTRQRLDEVLWRIGLLVLKPDALCQGKAEEALQYYARLGLVPVWSGAVYIDGELTEAIWRYQLNIATRERFALMRLVLDAAPSIVLLMRSSRRVPSVPCATILADSKGPADPDDREPWQLRTLLGSPNRVLSFVHCADEPLDVLRDGGLLLGPRTFARIVAGVHRQGEAHPVRLPGLGCCPASARTVSPEELARLTVQADLLRECAPASAQVDRWHLVTALAARVPLHTGTGRAVIWKSGVASWWRSYTSFRARVSYFADAVPCGRNDVQEPML